MSKKDEQELKKILGNLKRFVNRRKGHALAAITYPPTEEEAKGVFVAGDWVHWLTVGDTARAVDMIRDKFAKIMNQLKERDEAIVRDMEKREKAKQ